MKSFDNRELALIALNCALRIRRNSGHELWESICIYDLVEKHNVEVRFIAAPTLEGLYSRDPGPIILLGSERPSGRKAFTCAHEFGHHVFDHGVRVDKLTMNEKPKSPEEFLADCFAGYVLMPKIAVERAFSIRGWIPRDASSEQVFIVSCVFGVGYTTLVYHMKSLRLLSPMDANKLLTAKIKKIRLRLTEDRFDSPLLVVDNQWGRRPVDLVVGDLAVLPPDTLEEGKCVARLTETSRSVIFEAKSPGLGRFFQPNGKWSVFVRVSREGFEGRSCFRHLEE